MSITADGWLHPEAAAPDAAFRLFLFHCAGGGASMYHAWPALFPSDIAVQCVQLTGRQERYGEAAFTALGPLVEALVELVVAQDDGRAFGFFGHSMGALLAYRLAAALQSAGLPSPALVAAAGWAPAGFAMPDIGGLSDTQLIAVLRRLGAIPAEAGPARPDWLEPAVAVLRADFGVCLGYQDDSSVISAPIVAYAGADDPLMSPGALGSWALRTRSYLGGRTFPGGHFFLDREAAAIAADLDRLLRLPAR